MDKCQWKETKMESELIQPEDWRPRTVGIRHRKVKKIKGNIQEQTGTSKVKFDKELSQENQKGVRIPEMKTRARNKKGEEDARITARKLGKVRKE